MVTWLIVKVLATLFPVSPTWKLNDLFSSIFLNYTLKPNYKSFLRSVNLYGLFSNFHGLFSNMNISFWAAANNYCKFKVSQFPSTLINDLLTQFWQLVFQFDCSVCNWKLKTEPHWYMFFHLTRNFRNKLAN